MTNFINLIINKGLINKIAIFTNCIMNDAKDPIIILHVYITNSLQLIKNIFPVKLFTFISDYNILFI